MHGRHTKVRPHHYAAVVVAVLVALSFAFALAWVDSTRHDEPTTTAPNTATGSGGLQACEKVWNAQSETLDAAGRSLQQWRIHVDAMNQLVAGEITLAQAQAFWSRTRKGAAARVAKFETADGSYADVASQCAGDSRTTKTSPALEHCVAGVRARDRAIDAGTVAITTWKHHIMDMEMLRTGQITPERATRMWLRSWRQGVKELDSFSEVRKDAADAGSC